MRVATIDKIMVGLKWQSQPRMDGIAFVVIMEAPQITSWISSWALRPHKTKSFYIARETTEGRRNPQNGRGSSSAMYLTRLTSRIY